MEGCCPDETRSLGRAKAKQVGHGAPPTRPAEKGLFQPLEALRFLPGQEGAPFPAPGSDVHCRGQDPFPPGPSHSLEALVGRARPRSGGHWSRTRHQETGVKPCSVPSHCVALSPSCPLLHSVSPSGKWCWVWVPGTFNCKVLTYLEEATQQLQPYSKAQLWGGHGQSPGSHTCPYTPQKQHYLLATE